MTILSWGAIVIIMISSHKTMLYLIMITIHSFSYMYTRHDPSLVV